MRQKWQQDIEKRPHCRQTVEQPFAESLKDIYTSGVVCRKVWGENAIAAPMTQDHPG